MKVEGGGVGGGCVKEEREIANRKGKVEEV
jgi:hypothetical protein